MFISENTLDKLKSIKYAEKSKKQKSDAIKELKNTNFKDFNLSSFLQKDFPSNESVKTYQELKNLSLLPDSTEYAKKYDKISPAFKEVFIKHDLSYPFQQVKELLKDSVPVIRILKWTFNRPRPKQLAKYYKIDLGKVVNLVSMKTPSYPSGHSAQGYLVAHVLADEYPQIKNDLLKVAKHISKSRNIARAHYLSDSKFGEQLGISLYEFLKKEENNVNE